MTETKRMRQQRDVILCTPRCRSDSGYLAVDTGQAAVGAGFRQGIVISAAYAIATFVPDPL